MGKTTLAVHWAQQVAARFPDGQLYVNLRGFEPTGTAMTPTEVLRTVLGSLGVPPRAVPTDLHGQTSLYRSLLAGRRVLVLADNASDADQVRPLLPGTPGCLVIVTGRTQLPALVAVDGAHPVNLDPLPGTDARTLLANRVGADRLAAEPDAARRIVARCAGLPLALAIVSARAALHPRFPLAAIADELRAGGGLDAFALSEAIDVRDVFSWSYRALPPDAARLFRLLALHPGPDVTLAAAASVAGLPGRDTRALLATLTRSHLLTEHVPGRYAGHDLLREYAAELAQAHDSAAERLRARHRMLDHYLFTACAAARLFSPNRDPIPLGSSVGGALVADIADQEHASAWFTSEHAVLLAVIREAHAQRFDAHAWQLAWTVAHFLDRRGHWQDLLAAQEVGLAAAQRSGDTYGQAVTHRAVARADADLGLFDESLTHLRRTYDLFGELGDTIAQAHTHRQFSWVLEQRGDHEAALTHARQSLELYRKAGDTHGEAAALNAVGWYDALLGRHEDALAHCSQALPLLVDTGDSYGQADTLDSLGYAYHQLGRHSDAADAYRRAVGLYRELGVSYAEADTSKRLGDAYRDAGDTAAARRAWTRSLDLFTALGHATAEDVRTALTASAAVPSPSVATSGRS